MKKIYLFSLIIVLLSLAVLTGCDAFGKQTNNVIVFGTLAPSQKTTSKPKETEYVQETATMSPATTIAPTYKNYETPSFTSTPISKPTAKPSAPTAKPTATPKVDEYIDVWAEEQIFVINKAKSRLDLPGNVTDWVFEASNLEYDWSVEDDVLYLTCSNTGYVTLHNAQGDRLTVFSNNEVERTEARKIQNGFPYYLYFEKGTHTMTVYTADSLGYYTVPIRCFCCASGSTPAKTPIGTFKLGTKERWHTFSSKCLAQYGINYSSGVYLHSPCYEYKRESSILSHYYNTIGENSTGGCLRMQTAYIYWIYTYCDSGTKLEIVDGSPRGTSCKIPDDILDSACYDPTDPILKK